MLEFIYFTLLVDSELTPPSEVGKKVQFQELAITTAIILLALLLLKGSPQLLPQISLTALVPCSKEKCYVEASACGANPENKDSLTIDETCFAGKCENFSENGTTYFINEKNDICQEKFVRCTKKCQL